MRAAARLPPQPNSCGGIATTTGWMNCACSSRTGKSGRQNCSKAIFPIRYWPISVRRHDNQSWLGALSAVLDTCALVATGVDGDCKRQAQLTFAIARHAVVDLALIFQQAPREPEKDRLPAVEMKRLRTVLKENGLVLQEGSTIERNLRELRQMYEPYVNSLSRYLVIAIPPWIPEFSPTDNWQTTAWGTTSSFRDAHAPKGLNMNTVRDEQSGESAHD